MKLTMMCAVNYGRAGQPVVRRRDCGRDANYGNAYSYLYGRGSQRTPMEPLPDSGHPHPLPFPTLPGTDGTSWKAWQKGPRGTNGLSIVFGFLNAECSGRYLAMSMDVPFF